MKTVKVTSTNLTNLFSRTTVGVEYIQTKRNEKGTFRFMTGYFYRTNDGQNHFKSRITNCLKQLFPTEMENQTIEVISCGDEWKPFNGSAPIQRQSHYWVDVRFPIDFKFSIATE